MLPPRLLDEGAAIELDLGGRSVRFHAIWLRDNALDPATRSVANGQRLLSLLDVPADTRITEADWRDGRLSLCFAPSRKRVDYDPAWLLAHAYDKPPPPPPGWTGAEIARWDAATAPSLPVETYAAVSSDAAARRRWLDRVRRYGFARLSGAPLTEEAPYAVVKLFGHVRETNYGRSFDVRVETEPTNLAYTDRALQAHTDNPYRDPPPGLQVLVCLRNSVRGGGSILIDGFRMAEQLNAETARGFGLLTRHCARFAYDGAPGVRLHAKRPMIELGADGELLAIRFNNRSTAPLVDIAYDDMADYYQAYRRMASLIDDPTLGLHFRMVPGDVVVIDNLRVLHGRGAFVGGGERWLRGCYADRDGLLSTLAALGG